MNETSKKHIDSCRFCWMCRHICPIGNATGLERNTARARALGLSLVNRGVYDLSEVIDNVYECACCEACTKECVTGWDPVMFIRDARRDAAMEGKLPAYIEKLVDHCLDTGNAYGENEIGKELSGAIAAHAEKTDTLFFLGVDARYKAENAAVKAIRVMEKTGVRFTVLAEEPASGQQLNYLIGAAEETKAQMETCAKVIGGYRTVVVYDPQDAAVMKREYKEWNIPTDAEIVTFTAFLAARLDALAPEKKQLAVVYQDPFQLSRGIGETDDARRVISAYADLGEMLMHGKDTMWAGNVLMAEWMPDVMKAVALDRVNNAKGVKADTIVTASVSEYVSLCSAEQNDVKILSLEDLILG